MHRIPFNRAKIGAEEKSALLASASGSHHSGGGPFTEAAERLLSDMHLGAPALLTSSCTHALEMAARLLGLGDGDEVIVPSYTFVSSALAFVMTGAKPVFVDVRNDNLNLDESLIQEAISPATKAIVVVNYGGISADYSKIKRVAEENGLWVIEDNAHGLGAFGQGGVPLGTFGDISTVSFHETKNVSCGEGGAIILNNFSLLERAEILRDKGTNRSQFFRGMTDKYRWVDYGSSWIVSDLLASVLPSQLSKIQEINECRRTIWHKYSQGLSDWARAEGVRLQPEPKTTFSAHLFYLRLPDLESRTRLIQHLENVKIGSAFHYQALNTSPMAKKLSPRLSVCPVSEEVSDTLLRLPVHLSLKDADVNRVIEAVRSFKRA